MTSKCLVPINRVEAPKARILLVPYAGAGASPYSKWKRDVPPDTEFYVARLPGRENRLKESPIEDMDSAVIAIADEILLHREAWDEVPLAIGGDCSGARIAHALVAHLRTTCMRPPALLFVGSSGAPQRSIDAVSLHHLPPADLIAKLDALGGLDESVKANAELMDLIMPALRADLAIVERYNFRPSPPLTTPITVYGGRDDKAVSPGDLLNWSSLTSGRFTLRLLPGGHFVLTAFPEQVLLGVAFDMGLAAANTAISDRQAGH